MADEDLIIVIGDIRKAGHCVRGARHWFGGRGLDFKAFLKDGLPASVLLATGDALALQVVNAKRLREPDGQE